MGLRRRRALRWPLGDLLMSPFNRRGVLLVLFGAILTLGYAAMIFSWGLSLGESQSYFDHYRSPIQSKLSNDLTTKCSNRTGADRIGCIGGLKSDAREQERNELELQSQRQSSNWAFWSLILAGIQLPVGIFGLIALFRSLGQTERSLTEAARANEIANDAVRRELRAYIVLDRYEVKAKRDSTGKIDHYIVNWVWKNVGSTPAKHVSIELNVTGWHAAAMPEWFPWPNFPEHFVQYTRPNSMLAPGAEMIRSVGKISLVEFDMLCKFWSYHWVWGSLTYRDVFGSQHTQRYRRRSNLYGISHSDEWQEIDYGLVANDTGGDETADAQVECRPNVPQLVQDYVDRRGANGWLFWVKRQFPKDWSCSPDGTPAEQTNLPYRLKPESEPF